MGRCSPAHQPQSNRVAKRRRVDPAGAPRWDHACRQRLQEQLIGDRSVGPYRQPDRLARIGRPHRTGKKSLAFSSWNLERHANGYLVVSRVSGREAGKKHFQRNRVASVECRHSADRLGDDNRWWISGRCLPKSHWWIDRAKTCHVKVQHFTGNSGAGRCDQAAEISVGHERKGT
jgi:hypothetical protein